MSNEVSHCDLWIKGNFFGPSKRVLILLVLQWNITFPLICCHQNQWKQQYISKPSWLSETNCTKRDNSNWIIALKRVIKVFWKNILILWKLESSRSTVGMNAFLSLRNHVSCLSAIKLRTTFASSRNRITCTACYKCKAKWLTQNCSRLKWTWL